MVGLAAAALLAGGCEAQLLKDLRRDRSVEACSRYLATYPDGAHVAEARTIRDRARFQTARAADRPIGYTMYLRREPGGSYRQRARERLAEILLGRARSAADVELVVERYHGTVAARRADKRLAGMLAAESLESSDPLQSRHYLARYPAGPRAADVRDHLAQLLYPKVSNRLSPLERFARRFAGTRAGGAAAARVRRRLIAEVEAAPRRDALAELEARYPEEPTLVRLREMVREAELGRALSVLDLRALGKLTELGASGGGASSVGRSGGAAQRAAAVIAWCKRRKRRCEQLRQRARRAAPWDPGRGVRELQVLAYDADTQRAWDAIARLGWLDDAQAGEVLYRLAGSPRLAAVWSASRALRRWLALQPARVRQRWIQRRLADAPGAHNSDEQQRQAFLRLIATRSGAGGGPSASAAGSAQLSRGRGIRALQAVLRRPGRQLAASYLLLAAGGGQGIATLVSSARSRLKYLQEAFPDDLNGESLPAAQLAERELFAIQRAVREARAGRAGRTEQLNKLARKVDHQLAGWRLKLVRARSGYGAAHAIALAAEVRRHEEGRTAALRRMLRESGWVARAVSRALCEARRVPLLPAEGATEGRGPAAGKPGGEAVAWRRHCKGLDAHRTVARRPRTASNRTEAR